MLYRTSSFDILLKNFLFLILAIIPFQKLPATIYFAGKAQSHTATLPPVIQFINYIDEFSIVFALLAFLTFIVLKPQYYKPVLPAFARWIFIFFLVCLVCIVLNDVPVFQGLLGAYFYVKNFLICLIFFWLQHASSDLHKTISILTVIAIIMGIFGIFAQIVAMTSGLGEGLFVAGMRFGLYRVTSLAGSGNWNYIGIFANLVFFIVLVTRPSSWNKKIILFLIGSVILFSFSRQAWLGSLVLIFGISERKKITGVMLFIMVLFILIFYQEINTVGQMSGTLDEEKYFRLFTFLKAIETFLQHPLSGVGPGMFGGVISFLFHSPLYDSWPRYFYNFAYKTHGLDQFWTIPLADTGLLGALPFYAVFIYLAKYLYSARNYFKGQNDYHLYKLGGVLYYFVFCLLIMGFAGGLNSSLVTYPYFAVSGIYLAMFEQQKNMLRKHFEK